MIRQWLARNTGIAPLIERVATLEAARGGDQALIAQLREQLVAAQTVAAASVAALERVDRRMDALTHTTREGAARVASLLEADEQHAGDRETQENEIGRLRAAITILEARVESEALQTRRSATGLLERLEAKRRPEPAEMPDGAGAAIGRLE